ncbi:MAG: glycosyltransferase family 2 protein [Cytophagales bacterium]|nr:glycosyltransferase family 2 protein [Armatimonadota bacterium]
MIPAYNEADRIASTVTAAHQLPGVREVVVVDDGSSDATGDAAARMGARVVSLTRNRGKARAMEAGAEAAAFPLLLFLDADLGDTAREAAVLIPPVQAGEADMTIAVFPTIPGRGGGMGLVVRLSRWGVQRLTGRRLDAPLSGQRCLRRGVLETARPLASGFGVETALDIDALRAGWVVREILTRMDHRVTGNDLRARLHRARQLRDVARALLSRLLHRPRTRPGHSSVSRAS